MIADHLPRYYEAHAEKLGAYRFEVVRSIPICDHEVAWMKFTGTNIYGKPFEGYDVYCECYFKEGVGWRTDEKHGVVGLGGHERCIYTETAMHLRHLELRREYVEIYPNTWDGNRSVPRDHVQDVILDLVARSQNNPAFFIGEPGSGAQFWGGYFYLQTVAKITGHYIGHLWEDVHDLVAGKEIGLEGAVIQEYREPPPPKWEEYLRAEEDGWVATASLPGNRQMAREWKFEILKPDGTPAYALIPGLGLFHDPVFGPDVEDVERAKEHLGKLLDEAKSLQKEEE